jgi:hypothetical protein
MRFSIEGTNSKTVGPPAVLGLLAFPSLNLAAQPCLMASAPADAMRQGAAMPADQSDGVATERLAHRRIKKSIGEHSNCPHCDLSGHQNCTDSLACGALDAISPATTTKFKDAPASTRAITPGAQAFDVLPFAREPVIDPPADFPAAEPSLMVRYCVFRV